MKVLYYLEPLNELNNPFEMETWYKWYYRIHYQIASNVPNYDGKLLAFDDVAMYKFQGFSKSESILLSQAELRADWSIWGSLIVKIQTEQIDEQAYSKLANVISRKLGGFYPNVVFLLTESLWLRKLFPDAVFLNIEVSWLHRKPYPTFWTLDPVGLGRGRLLAQYAEQIMPAISYGEESQNFVKQFKQITFQKIAPILQRDSDVIEIKRKFHKIVLIPVSERYPIDGETPLFAYFDKFFEGSDIDTCYVITTHPMASAFSHGEAKYLTRKFKNVIISGVNVPELSTQILIPHVDEVIGDFSSVSYHSLIFDKPITMFCETLEYQSSLLKIRNPVSKIVSNMSSQEKDKILYLLLTNSCITEQKMFGNGWIAQYINRVVECKKNNSLWSIALDKFYDENEWYASEWFSYEGQRTNVKNISAPIEIDKKLIRETPIQKSDAVIGVKSKGHLNTDTRLIAFYLPQYHPILENDEWWGKGFTEWTNVAKAKPLFEGHYQPHIPADLGFYDLRLAETRKAQAEMAKQYGIYGFCYYHYWFNGKLLLEKPIHEVLSSGEPDFPFCLCWANEDWTRSWDGKSGEILIKQNYSDEDDIAHIKYLIKFFKDKRYIRINEKPLLLIYRASYLPNPKRTTDIWRDIAQNEGIGELFLCRVESFKSEHTDPTILGFDAAIEFQPDWSNLGQPLIMPDFGDNKVHDYKTVVQNMLAKVAPTYKRFPCVTPSWDNSPRRQSGACILIGSTPDEYERWLSENIKRVSSNSNDEKIVFINAWNEWGEGNHLEPDLRYGRAYLEATKRAIEGDLCTPIDDIVLNDVYVKSFTAYTDYIAQKHDADKKRESLESKENVLIRENDFTIEGTCYICNKAVDFKVDFKHAFKIKGLDIPHWRERTVCPNCKQSARKRALFHFFEQILKPDRKSNIYITEQVTSFFNIFKTRYPKTIGSEYIDSSSNAALQSHIHHEDITKLSFPDNAFDFIISTEVLEHVYGYKKALGEFLRVLKNNGALLLTVPFYIEQADNIVDAEISEDGSIVYNKPPVYHGDPIRNKGSLTFYHFGWQLLDDIRNAGFYDVSVFYYWSKEYCYYGQYNWIIIAKKKSDFKTSSDSKTHSTIVNRQKWSNYAWSQAGDEWSAAWGGTDNLWKNTIYPRIKLNLPADHILEIAPGFGRITQYLAPMCKTLTVVDITPRCIEACKERFKDYSHIRYFVNDGKSLDMIADNSIDFVFSWDSLVHAESDVLRSYLLQLSKKLKEGGSGFLHHSNVGAYKNPDTGQLSIVNKHWRATSMSAELFRQYCNEAGLVCATQEIIGWGGNILNDCFSYFIKDSSYSGPCTIVNELPDFMKEAAEAKKRSQTDVVEPYKIIQQLLDSGAYENALTALEKFIQDNPFHALAHNDIAAIYYQKGNKDLALKYFKKAASIEPDNIIYRRNLANLMLDMNRLSDALAILSRLVREHTDDVETLIAMGSLCYKLGAKDDARMFWESALDIDPDNAAAKVNIDSLEPDKKEPMVNSDSKVSVSIIIPIFNKVELTAQCLEALVANTEIEDYEVIIIDNASTDATSEFLKNLGGDVKIITNKGNLGFAKACNQGAKTASGEFLVFLNNDTIPQPGWLTELLNFIKSHPEAGVVGSKLLYPDGTIQHCGASMRFDGKFFRHQYKFLEASHPLVDSVRELDAVTAACFITKRDVFFKAGMFDEEYLNGCEDMDYCTAVRKMGFKIYYNPHSVLAHLESQTPRAVNKDEKNFARYISKWGAAGMRNEIEIYAEDGFWKRDEKDHSVYVKSSNQYLVAWQNKIKEAQTVNDKGAVSKYNQVIARIYPVDKWIRPRAAKKKEIDNNRPLKILFVCHDFPPYRYAGAQLYALNLAKTINKSGMAQVDIFHPIFREGYSKFEIIESQFEGLNVYKLSKDITVAFDNSVRHPIVAELFDKFLCEHKYDCIHIHGLGQLSSVPIEIGCKHGIPIVATLHDYWFLCYFWHMITPDQSLCSGPESIEKCARCFIKHTARSKETNDIYDKAYGFMQSRKNYLLENFRKINRVFAPSRFLSEKFYKYGFENITISPLGMVAIKAKQKKSSAEFTFGFVGQIIYRKGIETLLEAFKRLSHKNAVLVVYGKSDNDAYLKKIINTIETIPNAYYKGGYTPEDLPDIMAGIDISIIPSLMENYPLVVQEAFMNKVPVIASNVGGIPEVVQEGQNGFLFNVQDVFDLEKKMSFILDNHHIIDNFKTNIARVKTIEEDALLYSRVYNEVRGFYGCKKHGRGNKDDEGYEKRILFYFFKNVHIPILIPIYEKLKKLHPDVKIAFGYMKYAPEMRAGFTHDELEIIKSYGEKMYAAPQEFKSDVAFIADSVYPWVKNCGKLVHVGHGVLSKGQYYTDTAIARREEQADLVCVPGSYHAGIMKKIISKPIVATGMAKLDPLFSGEINRRSALKLFDLPEHYSYILFAPTFNDELSAIPFVVDEIYKLLPDKHTCLLIKLHGSAKKQYKEMYRNMMKKFSRIIYVDELDITPLLAIADVMVSDVSSAMMEFAALDKPLVLFNNPNWEKYQNFNPSDIEFRWRDVGIQVRDIEEMRLAVQRSLWQPEEFSAKRKYYTDQLFANKAQGNAAEKIIKNAFDLFLK